MSKPNKPKEKIDPSGTNIQVMARCRPRNIQEKQQGSLTCLSCNPVKKEVNIQERSTTKTFTFDRVFGQDSTQPEVFKIAALPVIEQMLAGYNCTLFAYGQTGTGKTYTMIGERSPQGSLSWEQDPMAGIIPRTMYYLFETLNEQNAEFSMKISYMELYNEELFDLLSPVDEASKLRIFEDSAHKGSCIVQGLEEMTVYNKDDVYAYLEKGQAKRQTASTLLNAHSSRSHSVFMITAYIKEKSISVGKEELVKVGKLNLVDLAGSENIGRSGAIDKRAREAGSINQSLLTLGRVITSLVDHSPHIPYRESKLTRLLQDSLGGRTKTSIIATISPALINLEETLSTLDYAHRAKNILNKPEINQKLTKKELIFEYTQEIERLKQDLLSTREKSGIFVSRDNYVGMETLIQSQKGNIDELEEQIFANEVKLRNTIELFESAQTELLQVSDQLEQKTQALGYTEDRLRTSESDRNRMQYLADCYKESEQQIFDDAQGILESMEQSEKDMRGLHNKLDRKQYVDTKNLFSISSFKQAITLQINSQYSLFQEYATMHANQIHNLRKEIKSWTENSSEELKETLNSINQVMSHVREFSKQQELSIDQNSCQQMFSLDSLCDSIQCQTGVFEEENKNMLNLFIGQLKGIINCLTENHITQQAKMKSCLSYLDDLRIQFNDFQKEQTLTVTKLVDYLECQETEFDKITKISKSNVLTQINEQSEFNKERVKVLTNDFSKEFDQMKEKFIRRLEENFSLQDENLKNKGNAVIEDLEKQRVKNREIIEHTLGKLTDLNEEAEKYPIQAKDASEKLQNYLGHELQSLSNEYCNDMRDKIGVMQTDLSEKLREMDARMQQHTDTIVGGVSMQKTQIDDNKQAHLAEHQAFMANLAVSAEDLESRVNDIGEQYVTDTSEKLLSSFEFLELSKEEVISSIFEISKNSVETVDKFELSKDIPSGATPIKKELAFKRHLPRPRPQYLLLENFTQSNSHDDDEKTDENSS